MILLYHGIVPDDAPEALWCAGQAIPVGDFERHLKWFLRSRRIIFLTEYVARLRRGDSLRRTAALTFDDGVGSYTRCVLPVLERLRVPATLFITTDHVGTGRPLWFNLLNALCFETVFKRLDCEGGGFPLTTIEERKAARSALGRSARESGDPVAFVERLAQKHPLPSQLAAGYAGLGKDEIRQLARSEMIEMGAHTLSHPFLSQCTEARQRSEIIDGTRVLAEMADRPVRHFAYPAGDYDSRTLGLVSEAGFESAVATVPKGLGRIPWFELDRLGMYSPSLWKMQLKVLGLARVSRLVGRPIG